MEFHVLHLMDCSEVAITPPGVQNLYPDGCTGVLGYGIDAIQTAPMDSVLLNDYILYVSHTHTSN